MMPAVRQALPIRVSVLATPDSLASPLLSIYDVLSSISQLRAFDSAVPSEPPYRVEIVAETAGSVMTASKIPVITHRAIDLADRTDLVVIPSIMTDASVWCRGRHAEVSQWLSTMHEAGALIGASCTGVFLLAETGLLDGKEATMHWSHARAFQKAFPQVRLNLAKMLLITGGRGELVMSGAATSWHDLVLYIVARQLGPPVAHVLAKFYAMQWHADGQAPFAVFTPTMDHGDVLVLKAQQWLQTNHAIAHPVEEMVRLAAIPERTFKRRFTRATGLSPIQYVQHLRIDQAKRRLEGTRDAVDEISWRVGYEDPAFFRRLFRRLTGIAPGAYRKTFTLPDFDRF
jgi:transcriptional regulator GlxA family with amidase domain